MLDLAAERKEELEIIVNISAELEKLITGGAEVVPVPAGYSINDQPDTDGSGEEEQEALNNSEYSAADNDINKGLIAKKKKKAASKLKKDENINDLKETLGPNEEDGITHALITKDSLLEDAK